MSTNGKHPFEVMAEIKQAPHEPDSEEDVIEEQEVPPEPDPPQDEEGEEHIFQGIGSREQTHDFEDRPAKLYRLRMKRITSLGAVTKKQNKLRQQMSSEQNLHLVKTSRDDLNGLVDDYQRAYLSYAKELEEEEAEEEKEMFEEKHMNMKIFERQVHDWIISMEQQLQDGMDRISEAASKTSRQSAHSSSSSKLPEPKRKQELPSYWWKKR